MTIFFGILWTLLAVVIFLVGWKWAGEAWDAARANKFTTTIWHAGWALFAFHLAMGQIYPDHIKAAFGL